MAEFHLTRRSTAPPAAVWDVVTDFAAYGDWMPATRMRVDAGGPRPGWGFAGISGLGRVGFSDSMLVSVWEPPGPDGRGAFRVVKTGRLLSGWAEVTVEPDGTGTRLDWHEDVVVRPLPFKRWFAPLLDRANDWLYGRAVDAMLAHAEERSR
ncbi:Carbon monoxide dehydrogenase subunit G [Pedococcus dokdonensis]|uniref:Carbon monoxide dehydrogenase subunit G n=1 Tax=Pedococcus dokdonensis TaxID=443156 RepID=A0A1H0KTR8_9MICO|nr:SRPBCC family protein [Pedococcus dokdonensis]SDO59181.1 Carbon monoxide dehydrogenase subunit G [Pedococcus dokdonensis]